MVIEGSSQKFVDEFIKISKEYVKVFNQDSYGGVTEIAFRDGFRISIDTLLDKAGFIA